MEKEFSQSKWIWKAGHIQCDDYAEFTGDFYCASDNRVYLDISADSNCNVYINGELVFFKNCADYPHYKLYDHVDITPYCNTENNIRIVVWYYGMDHATYYYGLPGLIFEITQGQVCLLASSEKIQSRTEAHYAIGRAKEITGQLGFTFSYDNSVDNKLCWQNSIIMDKPILLYQNRLKPLILKERTSFRILRQDDHCALVDLGREEVGFISLDLDSPMEQTVTIAYGEHIADGCVRRKIGVRDFSLEIRLASGNNQYCNAFRRLAGRYLEIFYDRPVHIKYLGLIPVEYPVDIIPFTAENELQQKIYDTAVRTLQLSMHEHYEDCPWREQAMYVLDSRNQMLCGYFCFDNALYARQNLILMTKGQKNDGLLELTYPARNTPGIPFFSIMYPVAVWEYVTHTGDTTILPEVMPAIERIMNAFRCREEDGLIASLPYPYWNFYEWSEGSAHGDELDRGKDAPYIKRFDLILNCAYVMAESCFAKLSGAQRDLAPLRQRIHQTFYHAQKHMYFASTIQQDLYTELGNSMAILSGVATADIRDDLHLILTTPNDMIKLTLSMLGFKYDALLMTKPDSWDYIIHEVELIYGRMLEAGASSFWETEDGQRDFGGAGSLCHGWSAMPVYYLQKYHQYKSIDDDVQNL